MKSKLIGTLSILAILLAGSISAGTFIADDADGDGVVDSLDACPAEDASYFDRDGDGCIDAVTGARHIEYWGVADTVVVYQINETGVPGIGGGSDFAALQAAMDTWPAITGTDLVVAYGGTTTQEDAAALDQINLITFVDDVYGFGSSVLAVGITTSFTVDSLYNGRLYRPGEIVDADMMFNPVKTFTTSGGLGTDVMGTAAHEAGHLYGISHSAVITSTMHYVLPPNTLARTLGLDDESVYRKAYPDAATLASANRITGTVTQGGTSDPLPGAIVFAISSASGDTAASDYTLPDGSYTFLGLPDGGYYVSIYPINGTSPINFLQPAYVNALVESTAVTLFVPEYWDVAESAFDNAVDLDVVNVAGGSTEVVDIITNIDNIAPTVAAISPQNNVDSVRVDAALLIRFSEPIDAGTLSGNFTLQATTGPDAGNPVGGNAAILNDDSVVAFTPFAPYSFDTEYELTLGTGIADLFGNTMSSPFVSTFITQPLPPLGIISLAPSKGVVGNTVVINGTGFSDVATTNDVSFNGVPAVVSQASPNRLVVTVPSGVTTGPVIVTVGLETSNDLTYTILSDVEIARGYQVGVSNLGSIPRSITVTPDGGYAYVATEAGASAVVVDAGLPNYLDNVPIPIAGGLDELDVTPDGKRVYGVSRTDNAIHVIDSDPADGPLFNQVLATIPTGAEALGIVTEPGGRWAFVSTSDGVIQKWDINLESATYQRQVGALAAPDANIRGKMAVTPAGDKLLALSGLGDLYVFDIGPDTLLTAISVGPDPHDVVVDPFGQRAYISDRTGVVGVVSLQLLSYVQDITIGGSVKGITITPAGLWVYTADEQLNHLDVIDLNGDNATFRSIAATIESPVDPVDVVVSPDGFHVFSLVKADQQMVATAIGLGPTLTSLSARAGIVGSQLVVNGNGFFDSEVAFVDFNGIRVNPERNTGSSMIVTVPPGATSGPVRTGTSDDNIDDPLPELSNAIFFEVLGPTPPGNIRLAAVTAPPGTPGMEDAMAISPLGDLAVIGGENGELFIMDIDPSSPSFNQFLGTVGPLSAGISDIAITPDGKMAFAVSDGDAAVRAVNIDRNSAFFGKLAGELDQTYVELDNPGLIKISPSGEFGIVYDGGVNAFGIFDLVEDSPDYFSLIHSIPMSSVTEFEIAPDGLSATVMEGSVPGIWQLILDPFSPYYLTLTGNMPFGGTPPPIPVSAAYYPDGDSVLVYAVNTIGPPERVAIVFDVSEPVNPSSVDFISGLPADGGYAKEPFRISPRGDRAIMNLTNGGFYHYDLETDPWTQLGAHFTFANLSLLDAQYTPDASRFYVTSAFRDSILIYDFSTAQTISIASGNLQVGVAGQPLPAPLRVQVSTTSGQSLAGVPITFQVANGGGGFDTGLNGLVTNVVVATQGDGTAEVDFVLGPALGSQDVEVIAGGLAGSPLTFISNALQNPATLPLQVAQVIPLNNTPDVSVTTAIQATFSRAVDPTTIADTTLYVHLSGEPAPVPVVYGFTSGGSKVSLTPIEPLAYNSTYIVEVTAGILDDASGALTNPQNSTFFTQSPPAPTLASVAPPSATENVALVLSGAGFDPVPGNNTVLFNDLAASPSSGGVGDLHVDVPVGATSGVIRVAVGPDTTNALPFNVLILSTSTVDDVLSSAKTGTGTKQVTVTPDGAIAYAASPDNDVVIPISVTDTLATYPSIPVGDYPIAIDIHPNGLFAYVANFGSAGLSVINTDKNSPDFNKVTSTLLVGANPVDVAVMPDGSRVLVANSGSNSLSVIDGDSSSVTHNTVIASPTTGVSTKTVTVSPDGSRIYIGTDDGVVVMESIGFAVLGSAKTGTGTKQVTISPDGTLLFVLSTEGEVFIIDVEPGSTTENSVLASAKTGTGTKTVTVSADGALLYLVQDGTDEVIVIAVETAGSVSVIDDPVILPPKSVNIAFVDTIPTDNNPEWLAIDPRGTGRFLISTSGDEGMTLYGEFIPEVAAEIHVRPRTIRIPPDEQACGDDPDDQEWWNTWRGRYIRGWIELPEGYDPLDIDIETVRLNGVVPGTLRWTPTGDRDQDGIPELRVKFDRVVFDAAIPQGEYVPVTISGMVNGERFSGPDTIRTLRPTVTYPAGGETFPPNTVVTVTWDTPQGIWVDYVDVFFTCDEGQTWLPIVEGVPNQGFADWVTPIESSQSCRVMVTLYKDFYRHCFAIGQGMSAGTFSITAPVSVTLTNFEGAVEDGDAVMRWTTGLEIGTEGFHLLRSDSEDGLYDQVTDEMVPARGNVDGASYEYRDDSVRPNRRYFYKLQEVVQNDLGSVYGPYEVSYKVSFGLEQNVPNPFNPTTTIRFSVASDTRVRLIVYDVAGRRVRTLVDENRKADVYKLVWDGHNDAGQPVATGVYFYRMTAGKFTQTRKMLLLK